MTKDEQIQALIKCLEGILYAKSYKEFEAIYMEAKALVERLNSLQ